MTIVKNQNPLILKATATVRAACAEMCRHRAGSVLVVDDQQRLCGIFTGRDAVRVLANSPGEDDIQLSGCMTAEPVTIDPKARAIDALRLMSDGGFRHLPVVDNGRIWGIVSRSDFLGSEIERLDEDEHLAQCIW
jgi:CBS domain-containing protein